MQVSEHESANAFELLSALNAATHALPLQQLDFSKAKIGHEGGMQVASIIKPKSPLADIDLNRCHIGDAAVAAIAQAIRAQGNHSRYTAWIFFSFRSLVFPLA